MLDSYSRNINYLRISVTDRCNLRCIYCMPAEGIDLVEHDKILKFEEITQFTGMAVSKGVNKVRLTGGEPLVRKGIVDLVQMLSKIKEIKDFGMTTNGILLSKYAKDLKKAGLHRVNVSLDTLDSIKYKTVTRGGELHDVLLGIEAAKDAGLNPVKINTVIKNSITEKDATAVAEWAKKNNVQIRFIKQMDLQKGKFGIVHGGTGGDCKICNRLRLTSDGYIKPCLFNDTGINIRKIEYEEAFEKAIKLKPKCGESASSNKFYNIGG